MKRRNKRNDRERQEQEKQVETIEELKDKWITMYFENEEELEWYIKYHNIKNFEYVAEARTIKFQVKELIKEK